MTDSDLDSVRRVFADLTGLFEEAAHIASERQGVKTLDGRRSQFRRISKTMNQIRMRLVILNGRLR